MPTNEPIPGQDIQDMLNTYWNASNVVKPVLTEVTGDDQPIRIDLNRGDHVIIRVDSPALEERPIGNWTYANRLTKVLLEVVTKEDRQRLYNLMREIRRICHARIHSLVNYQRIRFDSFNELTNEQQNIWEGRIILTIENNAIVMETT